MRNTFCRYAAALLLILGVAACGDSGPTVIGPDHLITVDGTQSLDQMVDAGSYDSITSSINPANFPITNQGKRDETMVLVAFNRSISSENAVDEMKARNLRPAALDECLAYGVAIARARQDYGLGAPSDWIVCLGQSAMLGGHRDVPELWRLLGYWGLGLDRWGADWSSGLRFLAVRM